MGKRARRRDRSGGKTPGPTSFADLGIDLDLDVPDPDALAEAARDLGEHGVLVLRTGMSPGTRAEYEALRKGQRSTAASTQEDRWARAVEFLFERLVVRWEIAGVATTGAKDLLRRYRVTTPTERAAIRDALRDHLAEHLPEVPAP
ncbi:hypothetical protein [Paraconexibacter sp.]|uniref:hypothetical protein n=1 Tax=Paraconexibacter sp. TaxID=2949640 RepID=UPI003567A5EC